MSVCVVFSGLRLSQLIATVTVALRPVVRAKLLHQWPTSGAGITHHMIGRSSWYKLVHKKDASPLSMF